MPVTIYNFNSFTPLFFISNIMATPFIGGVMLLGFLNLILSIFSSFLAGVLGVITNLMIEGLILVSMIGAEIPFSNLVVRTPSLVSVLTYYLTILTLKFLYQNINSYKKWISKSKNKKVLAGVITALLLGYILINALSDFLNKNLRIYFIDVRTAVMQALSSHQEIEAY